MNFTWQAVWWVQPCTADREEQACTVIGPHGVWEGKVVDACFALHVRGEEGVGGGQNDAIHVCDAAAAADDDDGGGGDGELSQTGSSSFRAC